MWLNMTKNPPKIQKNVYSVPFLSNEHEEFILWFFTGSKCNLECTHCYVESGPKANIHPFLTLKSFKKRLNEVLKQNYSKLQVYFTGGEPFINPDILEMISIALNHADTTILTNAILLNEDKIKELFKYQKQSKFELNFRISLDGSNAESNDRIRGNKSYERTINSLTLLVKNGFNPILTIFRNWSENELESTLARFSSLLEDIGVPVDKQRVKILPPLRIGREADRNRPYTERELFTEQCFVNYDYDNLQCSHSRIASENGLWVCPILINEKGAFMGYNLKEASQLFQMTYMACWTCRMEGMNCAND